MHTQSQTHMHMYICMYVYVPIFGFTLVRCIFPVSGSGGVLSAPSAPLSAFLSLFLSLFTPSQPRFAPVFKAKLWKVKAAQRA